MITALLQTALRYFGPGANVIRWVTFPLACAVGTCGYYLEQKYFGQQRRKPIPYLEQSRIEERMQRQVQEEFGGPASTSSSSTEEEKKLKLNAMSEDERELLARKLLKDEEQWDKRVELSWYCVAT